MTGANVDARGARGAAQAGAGAGAGAGADARSVAQRHIARALSAAADYDPGRPGGPPALYHVHVNRDGGVERKGPLSPRGVDQLPTGLPPAVRARMRMFGAMPAAGAVVCVSVAAPGGAYCATVHVRPAPARGPRA